MIRVGIGGGLRQEVRDMASGNDISFYHCFAVCAYKESPYLKRCVESCLDQRGSRVILCTSTPNELIRGTAERYGLRLYAREGKSSLRDDWNFAVNCAVEYLKEDLAGGGLSSADGGSGAAGADTGGRTACHISKGKVRFLVTIAHQDDVYHEDYLKAVKNAFGKYPDTLVCCTRYRTVDKNGFPVFTRAESVKRILRLPLRLREFSDMSFIKRLPLIFGNSVGCPTCTYDVSLTGREIFKNYYYFVIDWDALLALAKLPGRFLCVEKELVDYRVHPDAETKRKIDDHTREKEEREIFLRLWPKPIANLLMRFYKLAYADYDAKTES